MYRTLLALPLVVGLLVVGAAPAWAATAGVYEGSVGGITVAATVQSSGAKEIVTHTGAICSAGDGSALTGSDDGGKTYHAYRISRNGGFGRPGSDTYSVMSGHLDAATGTIAFDRGSQLVSDCDPAHAQGSTPYSVPVTRVGPVRRNVVDGEWSYTEPGQAPGSFEVFGGGAFVGNFEGTWLGSSQGAACADTPAQLVQATVLSPSGAFTLPWEPPDSLGYTPLTPTTGQLNGTSGSFTYTLDSPTSTGTLSSVCPQATTPMTIPLALKSGVRSAKPAGAPASGPIPTGGTTPSVRCSHGQFKTSAGPFVICSEAKPHLQGGVVMLSGRVTINGFLYAEVKRLEVHRKEGRITSDGDAEFGVIVSGYDVPLGRVPLALQAQGLGHARLTGLRSGLKLGGLKLNLARFGGSAPTADIDLAKGSLSVTAGVDYRLAATTLSLQGSLQFASSGVVADLTSDGLSLPVKIAGRQLFTLHSLSFRYDSAKDAWSLGGGAEVALPDGPGLDATVKGGVVRGRFDSLSVELAAGGDTGLPGPFDTYLSGGSFDLSGVSHGFHDATIGVGLDGGWPLGTGRAIGVTFKGEGSFDIPDLRLTLAAHANVSAGDVEIAKGDAKLVLTLAEGNRTFALDAHVNVLDILHGDATLRIDSQHFLAEGKLIVEFGPDSPPIKFLNDVVPFPASELVPDHIGPLASADAIVSDVGAGAHVGVKIGFFHTGVTAYERWGHGLKLSTGYSSVKLGRLNPYGPNAMTMAHAAARGRTEAIRVGDREAALVISGSGSATGQLIVRDPRGRTVLDTRHIHRARVQRAGFLFARDATGARSGVIIDAPRPGRWQITSLGAHPFRAVRATTFAAPDVGVGRVLSVSPQRRVRAGARLRVRVVVPRGETVQIRGVPSRRGDAVGAPLGVTRHRTAVVRVPAGWHARQLTLLAVTRRDGVSVARVLSRVTLRVVAQRLGRPGHLRVSRGARTTVRFSRAAGAGRYLVAVRLRGLSYETVTRRTRLRLPIHSAGARTVVIVRGVSANTGAIGPAAHTQAGASHARRRRHQP